MTEKISLAKIIENAGGKIELMDFVAKVAGPFDKMEISGETGRAIRDHNLPLVKWLVNLPEGDINYKVDNYSHLSEAIRLRNIGIVKILIDAGADLWYMEKDSKRTLVHTACLYGDLHILNVLLKYKECVQTIPLKTESGKTALDLVCKEDTNLPADWISRAHMAKDLLEHYTTPPAFSGRGNNPVHVAVMAENLDLVKEFILVHKISPYLTNKVESARDLACRLRYTQIVEFIDGLGTDESKKDDEEEFVDVPLVEFNEATVAEWCKKNGYILGKAI